MMQRIHRLLELPAVYRLSQAILAAGQQRWLGRRIAEILEDVSPGSRILDVGCGPESWLPSHGVTPVGLDVSRRYVSELAKKGTPGVVGSADALPFSAGSFDAVFSIGLLHHLPDATVRGVMEECARVCQQADGRLVVLEAVPPRSPWRRPMAHWIRRADRGRFMRTEEDWRALLLPAYRWSMHRFTYTLTGMEALACVCRLEPGNGQAS
jgi:ubiquinone/menaquinone biosynthesis C-methylase UbiE